MLLIKQDHSERNDVESVDEYNAGSEPDRIRSSAHTQQHVSHASNDVMQRSQSPECIDDDEVESLRLTNPPAVVQSELTVGNDSSNVEVLERLGESATKGGALSRGSFEQTSTFRQFGGYRSDRNKNRAESEEDSLSEIEEDDEMQVFSPQTGESETGISILPDLMIQHDSADRPDLETNGDVHDEPSVNGNNKLSNNFISSDAVVIASISKESVIEDPYDEFDAVVGDTTQPVGTPAQGTAKRNLFGAGDTILLQPATSVSELSFDNVDTDAACTPRTSTPNPPPPQIGSMYNPVSDIDDVDDEEDADAADDEAITVCDRPTPLSDFDLSYRVSADQKKLLSSTWAATGCVTRSSVSEQGDDRDRSNLASAASAGELRQQSVDRDVATSRVSSVSGSVVVTKTSSVATSDIRSAVVSSSTVEVSTESRMYLSSTSSGTKSVVDRSRSGGDEDGVDIASVSMSRELNNKVRLAS